MLRRLITAAVGATILGCGGVASAAQSGAAGVVQLASQVGLAGPSKSTVVFLDGDPGGSSGSMASPDSGLSELWTPIGPTTDDTPGVTRLARLSELLRASQSQSAGETFALLPSHGPGRRSDVAAGVLAGVANLPEPGTWALLLLGFGVIGVLLRANFIASRELADLRSDEGLAVDRQGG
jgi:hypothetical protein